LIDLWWGNDPKTAGPYPPKKQVGSLTQGDYPAWNPEDGVWQNPNGSKTKGSGPTWVNPNGVREDNYEGDVNTQRTVSDENQLKAGWRLKPEAPKYGPTTAQPVVAKTYPYGQFSSWDHNTPQPNSEK